MHGALNQKDSMPNRSFFHFREQKVAMSTDELDNPEKMAALKSNIERSGLPVHYYREVEQLGQRVFSELAAAIETDYPSKLYSK